MIQCKFYAEDHRIRKQDIDSFFTASGQKPFTHRIIVTTTNDVWIAALASEYQLPILSRDQHFDYVEGNQRIEW